MLWRGRREESRNRTSILLLLLLLCRPRHGGRGMKPRAGLCPAPLLWCGYTDVLIIIHHRTVILLCLVLFLTPHLSVISHLPSDSMTLCANLNTVQITHLSLD